MPGLQHEMTFRLRVSGPLAATEGAPTGTREYWQMTDGTLTGERMKAKMAMPGGDWMLVSADRFWRPDVRVQFVTEDRRKCALRRKLRVCRQNTSCDC